MYKNLEKYLEGEQVKVKDLANLIGVAPATIYRYIEGVRRPRPEIAFKIVDACEKKIRFDSFYS